MAPSATISRLRGEADEVVCLHAPAEFESVGQFFADFSEVTDDDVVRLLGSAQLGSSADERKR